MKETKIRSIDGTEKDIPVLKEAGQIIRAGGLVVFPTETVYGIGANGLDADACRSIYTAKGRPSDNPLILTVPGKEEAKAAASYVPALAEKLMDIFWPGPLTLVLPRKAVVPDAATGGLDTVALRCPAHAGCRAFLRAASTIVEVLEDEVVILRPGAVTEEMLAAVTPRVTVDKTLITGTGVPKAPGMKYRHYAPNAPMQVFYLVSTETADLLQTADAPTFVWGRHGDKKELARNLYTGLLFFDTAPADYILAEGVAAGDIGTAVMNRMKKAAAGAVVDV